MTKQTGVSTVIYDVKKPLQGEFLQTFKGKPIHIFEISNCKNKLGDFDAGVKELSNIRNV